MEINIKKVPEEGDMEVAIHAFSFLSENAAGQRQKKTVFKTKEQKWNKSYRFSLTCSFFTFPH